MCIPNNDGDSDHGFKFPENTHIFRAKSHGAIFSGGAELRIMINIEVAIRGGGGRG